MKLFKKRDKELLPKTEESVADVVSAEQLEQLYSEWDRSKKQKKGYRKKIDLLEKEIEAGFEQIANLYKHSDKISIDYQFVIEYADGSKFYYKLLGPSRQRKIENDCLLFLRVGTDWTQISIEEVTIGRSINYGKRITFEEFKEVIQSSINQFYEFIDTAVPQLSTIKNVICHQPSENNNNNQPYGDEK